MTTSPAGLIPEWTRGDRLRKARALTGMTTREFADHIGVSQKTVTDAENDKRETVRKILLNAWALAAGLLLVGAPPVHADEDATPGCVSRREWWAAWRVDAKRHMDQRMHSRGYPAMFSGEVDFATGHRYVNHSPYFVKYVYPGCTGRVYVIFELPNEYHPRTREWVQMRYQDFAFPTSRGVRSSTTSRYQTPAQNTVSPIRLMTSRPG